MTIAELKNIIEELPSDAIIATCYGKYDEYTSANSTFFTTSDNVQKIGKNINLPLGREVLLILP